MSGFVGLLHYWLGAEICAYGRQIIGKEPQAHRVLSRTRRSAL
jgi:hypothetical protein